MQTKQVTEIIKKLESAFNSKYRDILEFSDMLLDFDYDAAIKAVNHLAKNGINKGGEKHYRLPNLPEFYEVYKLFSVPEQVFDKCDICRGHGTIVITEYELVDNEIIRKYCGKGINFPIQIAIKCACKGGTTIHRLFDVNQLRSQVKDKGPVPMPDYVKQICKQLGINIKSIMGVDFKCPF